MELHELDEAIRAALAKSGCDPEKCTLVLLTDDHKVFSLAPEYSLTDVRLFKEWAGADEDLNNPEKIQMMLSLMMTGLAHMVIGNVRSPDCVQTLVRAALAIFDQDNAPVVRLGFLQNGGGGSVN